MSDTERERDSEREREREIERERDRAGERQSERYRERERNTVREGAVMLIIAADCVTVARGREDTATDPDIFF